MNRPVPSLWLSGLLLAGALHAQATAPATAPFTGVVRDDAGAPIANAAVVCAWRSTTSPEVADRREVQSDADGRFAVELPIGIGYAVWVIGPADPTGAVLVRPPEFDAAGGKHLDLIADLPLRPLRLQVTGTAPWIADGPLALRLVVAEGLALGPDLPIPGDGPVPLPPLPTDLFRACLVDGKSQILDSVLVDSARGSTAEFTAPETIDLRVEDPEGEPIDGAEIWTAPACWMPGVHPLQRTGPMEPFRLVATSDENGAAQARVVVVDDRVLAGPRARVVGGTSLRLFAMKPGRSTAVSGIHDGQRFENGAAVGDDGPLRLVLGTDAAVRLRVLGAETVPSVRWSIATSLAIKLQRNGRLGFGLTSPARPLVGGELVGAGWHGASQIRVTATGRGDGATPFRMSASTGDPREPLDLRALRRIELTVRDAAGNPASGAHIGIVRADAPYRLSVLDGLVTNAAGRAELLVGDEDRLVYACQPGSAGVAFVAKGGGECIVTLAALAQRRLRVLDGSGAAVHGARIVTTGGSRVTRREAPAVDQLLVHLAAESFDSPARRTDAAGEVVVYFHAVPDAQCRVQACRGKEASGEVTLTPGDEALVLVLDRASEGR